MAALSKVSSSIAGSFRKLFPNHSGGVGRFREDPTPLSSFLASPTRRAVHCYYSSCSSSYDKNVDDQARPTVVPDYIVESGGSSNYWGPHPTTGVFGPADPESIGPHGLGMVAPSRNGGGGSTTVLDRTVWFRSGEDGNDLEEEEPPY